MFLVKLIHLFLKASCIHLTFVVFVVHYLEWCRMIDRYAEVAILSVQNSGNNPLLALYTVYPEDLNKASYNIIEVLY